MTLEVAILSINPNYYTWLILSLTGCSGGMLIIGRFPSDYQRSCRNPPD